MNPGYIKNSVADKTLNEFSYRPISLNKEPYFDLKSLNYNKNWEHIVKPNEIKQLIPKYNGSLPFDHGHYNEFEHLNTFSTHNYIPQTYPIHRLFPNVGTMASIMKRRNV